MGFGGKRTAAGYYSLLHCGNESPLKMDNGKVTRQKGIVIYACDCGHTML